MARQHVDVTATSAAEPAAVYALLRDGATWPTWSPLGSFELDRAGAAGKEGLGAVRVFRTGRITNREEIVELVPDQRLSYVLLSGLGIRGYRADIDLTPVEGGTTIRWRSSFTARVPGTGWLYRRSLTRFITQCANGLAEHAAAVSRRS